MDSPYLVIVLGAGNGVIVDGAGTGDRLLQIVGAVFAGGAVDLVLHSTLYSVPGQLGLAGGRIVGGCYHRLRQISGTGHDIAEFRLGAILRHSTNLIEILFTGDSVVVDGAGAGNALLQIVGAILRGCTVELIFHCAGHGFPCDLGLAGGCVIGGCRYGGAERSKIRCAHFAGNLDLKMGNTH